MADEMVNVIQAQIHLMEIDLNITLQRTKVAELNARARTLKAREKVEAFKLEQMIQQSRNKESEIKNEKKK